eukprot:COSAG02_NODE_1071_length_14802_cov_5.546419_1_plen_1063_part_00
MARSLRIGGKRQTGLGPHSSGGYQYCYHSEVMDCSIEVPPASRAGTGFSRLPNTSDDEVDGGGAERGSSGTANSGTARVLQVLRKTNFARGMDSQSLMTLARAAERNEYSRGEAVIRQGERGDSLYIVVSGSFDVLKASTKNADRVATISRPGDHFGEASVLDPSQMRTATIEAASAKATALRLKRQDVLPILTEHISTRGKESLLQSVDRQDSDFYDAPRWLEKLTILECLQTLYLGRSRTYWVVFSLLVLAPFVAASGRVARLVYGCPTMSNRYDAMSCAGIFSFCFVWPFLFWDFSNAVRGLARIQSQQENEEARANAHVLASHDTDNDMWLSAADRYRALIVAANVRQTGRPKMRQRFLSKAYDATVRATSILVSESLEVDDPVVSEELTPALQAGHLLHVRGIGKEDWDGTLDGRARFEHDAELRAVFSEFGPVLNVTVRHRVADGANTSWAFVAMGTSEARDAVLAAPAVMAGSTKLEVNRFDRKMLAASTGMAEQISQSACEISSGAAVDVVPVSHGTASASHVASVLQAGHLLHVRGIGKEDWDGTPDGRARFEHDAELRAVFSEFGPVLNVTVRHRVADGANTSWALVAMGTSEARDAVLAAPAVMAGSTKLEVNLFDKKTSMASKGMSRTIAKNAVAAVRSENAKRLAAMVGEREAALAKERAILEAKRDVMREALANSLEVECEINVGYGGAALSQADEDLLRAEFEEADVGSDGVMDIAEWAPLIEKLLGIRELKTHDKQELAREALKHDRDGDGLLSVDEFIQMWNDKARRDAYCGTCLPAPGSGPLCKLSFQGGLGIHRQTLTRRIHFFLKVEYGLDCILAVILVSIVGYLSIGMIEIIMYDVAEGQCEDCNFAGFARFIIASGSECVPRAILTANMIGVVLVLIPAGLLAALLWPLWLYSLQIAVAFAAADVSAVMQELRPQNVRRWQTEALRARQTKDNAVSQGEMLWQTDVALPGALLIPMMKRVSEWGSSLGAAILGSCIFGIGLLPCAFHSEWAGQVKAAIVAVVFLPALVALQPAYLSSRCMLMHEQLNNISCVISRSSLEL